MKTHKTAHQIFEKILFPSKNSKTIRKSSIKCLEELLDYLESLSRKHISKKYSEDHLVNNIFQHTRKIQKPQQIDHYCKCHLYVATNWLKELISDLKKHNETSHHDIIKLKDHISAFLSDIKSFIEYFERKTNRDFVYYHGQKYYGQHSHTIFLTSIQLYWQSSKEAINCSHSSLVNLSTFTLRQAIEIKLQRIIGVHAIYNRTGTPLRTELVSYSKFISENKDLIKTNCHSIDNIIKIINWTNTTIHKGTSPYIWEQWYALTISKHLFDYCPEDRSKGWSINDSVEVIDYDKIKIKFINFITKKESEIYCFEFINPEAVIFSEPSN